MDRLDTNNLILSNKFSLCLLKKDLAKDSITLCIWLIMWNTNSIILQDFSNLRANCEFKVKKIIMDVIECHLNSNISPTKRQNQGEITLLGSVSRNTWTKVKEIINLPLELALWIHCRKLLRPWKVKIAMKCQGTIKMLMRKKLFELFSQKMKSKGIIMKARSRQSILLPLSKFELVFNLIFLHTYLLLWFIYNDIV